MDTIDVAGHILRAIRAEMAFQKISQEQLGMRIGIDQRSVSRRLTGETPLEVAELVAIADALAVPITKFLPDTARAT